MILAPLGWAFWLEYLRLIGQDRGNDLVDPDQAFDSSRRDNMTTCDNAPNIFGRRHNFLRTYDTPHGMHHVCNYCGQGKIEVNGLNIRPPTFSSREEVMNDLGRKGFLLSFDELGRLTSLKCDGDSCILTYGAGGEIVGMAKDRKMSLKERKMRPDMAISCDGEMILPMVASRVFDRGYAHENAFDRERQIKKRSGIEGNDPNDH
jgi:hypothetical protein